ncbi:acyltransferase family protein [Glacieibacterium sp.]|uniref:acyltransferase family protein n=1 Tax=Glacieibacterium sp. TaxID=2860237 RepID=UPI003B00EA1D
MAAWLQRPISAADLKHDGNIFTALRWILASTVMFSHAWDLTQWRNGLDPSVGILTFPVSRLAVYLFFSLSGFLVTGSLLKRGIRDFAIARALRMIPGLWTMLLVTTIGVGLAFTTLPAWDFLVSPKTATYLWRNALLLGGDYGLPGVFDGHRNTAVNGSLWTIPQEVRCYITLALLGAVGLLAPRRWLLVAFLVAVVVHVLVPIQAVPLLANPRRLAVAFFIGVTAYQWRDRIPLSWPFAIVGALGAVIFAHLAIDTVIATTVIQVAAAYLTLVAAFRVPAALKRTSAGLPDYSYGIYIYAFPAQQIAISMGWSINPLSNIAIGFAMTLPFAALSWHFIEQPALKAKTRV